MVCGKQRLIAVHVVVMIVLVQRVMSVHGSRYGEECLTAVFFEASLNKIKG